ncbi:unnamed protein product, partial [Laminaria digitata]
MEGRRYQELEAGVYAGLVLATAEETFGRQRATDLGRNAGLLPKHKKHHHAVTSTTSSKSGIGDDDVPILSASKTKHAKKKDFLYCAERVGGDHHRT